MSLNPSFRRFFDHAYQSFLLLLDQQWQILEVSENFNRHIAPGQDPIGKPASVFLKNVDGECCLFSSTSQDLPLIMFLELKDQETRYHCQLSDHNGHFLLLAEQLAPPPGQAMESMSLIVQELASLSRDLRRKNLALQKANETINELMRTDPLTGLANRRHLNEQLAQLISLGLRHHDSFSLIMADIDKFKSVNDTWGHDQGDLVLKEFAAIMKKQCRQEDLPARFGGEEFLILLPRTDLKQATIIAERIRIHLESALPLGAEWPVTASFGIARFAEQDDQDSLLKKADLALYQAKEGGRNQTRVFELATNTGNNP